MAAYTVYLDQVFLGNLAMNYAILWAAARLSRTSAGRGRIAAGAALGAVYALAVLFPGTGYLLTVWFKTLASLLITAVVFAPISPKKFLACLGAFYLCSFALGGLTLGMIFFINSENSTFFNGAGAIIAEHFWPGLILGLAAFWAAGKGLAALMKKGVFDGLFKMDLLIRSGDMKVQVEALLDTGNRLSDPLTGRPVIVVEYEAMEPLLPLEVREMYAGGGEPDVWQVLAALGQSPLALRFGAVPFQSLGRDRGMLLGFKPDEVFILRLGRQVPAGKVMVGICPKKLDTRGSYRALLTPDLLDSAWL